MVNNNRLCVSCVSGCGEASSPSDRSSSWWNDSTSIDDSDAAGLDRSPTAGDPDRGGQLGSRHCRTNADCDATVGTGVVGAGVSCYWLYDGCQTGRCMCDPRHHIQSLDGRCIPRKLLPLPSSFVSCKAAITSKIKHAQ